MSEYRYTIFCGNDMCGEDRGLIPLMGGDFSCPFCGTTYDWESGVQDNDWNRQFQQSYVGAKRAGLIKESDVPRETR